MKKTVLISAILALLASTAMAGNVTQDVSVTGTVESSCVFEGDATPLTFKYTAANGISDQTGGSTGTLHCNFGSIDYTDHPPVITVTKEDVLHRVDGSGAVLRVDLKVEANEAYAGGPGTTYYGSDSRIYTVTASAPTNQWTVPNADYAGVVTVSVDF